MTAKSDRPFLAALLIISGFYLILIVAMVVAQLPHALQPEALAALGTDEILFAIKLSLTDNTSPVLGRR